MSILLVFGVVAFSLLRYHFILIDSKVRILKKATLNWQYTFVDARGTNRYKLVLNPVLAKAGLKDLFHKEDKTIDK
ncbi:MAG: hypothetical protein KKH68_05830 [Proteobacteria bacterium]|nr:hypothetical protein [Pseudomonadota bacterium]